MGRACVRAFQDAGPLLLVDVDEARAADVASAAAAAGAAATHLVADVSRAADIESLAERVATGGGLRSLVHLAGVSPMMADAATVLDVDLVGTARITDALLPLSGPGSVAVCIASIAGQMAPSTTAVDEVLQQPLAADLAARLELAVGAALDPGMAYSLAKRGVILLCEQQAAAWGARGARIVSVSPGLIDTPMGRLEAEDNAAMTYLLGLTPVNRPPDDGSDDLPGRVDDIASAAAFLCSPAASFVSGCDLRVDGGLVAALRNGAVTADRA
jgi:NAD(P)-dependent dehydrogenase (short-subunit alcohol dehydrogenase family)